MEKRGTDAPDVIKQRLDKAAYEMTFANRFDRIIVNDDLTKAQNEAYEIVSEFLKK